MLYVLDTDHLSLYRHGHKTVSARIEATPASDLAITIVTIEEQLTGWYTQIRKARNIDQLERAYRGLVDVIDSARRIQILPFHRAALEEYVGLRKLVKRVGKMDLAISAIVLKHNGTVVTRNRSDFELVPGLVIEDWSKP
jgi:tRNA(fMet)-specific endonuclease VapC